MSIIPTIADIYHGNPVDFGKIAAAGIWGVIHKARQGLRYSDPSYHSRMDAAKAAGLLWAGYDFATGDDVELNVSSFLAFAALSDSDGAWLDFEDNAASQMSADQAWEFLDRVAQKRGRACGIYGGNRIREHINPNNSKWIDMAKVVPLWQCRYIGLQPADNEELFKVIHPIPPWTKNTIIQYTGDRIGPQPHTVDGLQNGADLNAFLGTRDDLAAIWPGQAIVKPAVTS
jgi:GH25 family lysozyme M1 (1,4-beta-N-acetylmuramidase)